MLPRSTSAAVIPRRIIDNLLQTTIFPARHDSADIRRDLEITKPVTLNQNPLIRNRGLGPKGVIRLDEIYFICSSNGRRSKDEN